MDDAESVAGFGYAVGDSRENCANVRDVIDGAVCADNAKNVKVEIYNPNEKGSDCAYCLNCTDDTDFSNSL